MEITYYVFIYYLYTYILFWECDTFRSDSHSTKWPSMNKTNELNMNTKDKTYHTSIQLNTVEL